MATTQNQHKLSDLLKNPTALMDAFKNPGKFGLNLYRTLSPRNKQYLAFAGAIGLIIYGVTLNKQK